MHFRVAVAEYLPFLRLTSLSGSVYATGPIAEAFQALAAKLNFTYTLCGAKTWGKRGDDGWTGMLGMIEREEVDMAIGPFTLTYDRWSSFRMSSSIYVDNVEILSPVFTWRMTVFNAINVFNSTVWLYLLVSVVVVSTTFSLLDKHRQRKAVFRSRFLRHLWNVVFALMHNGRLEKTNCFPHSLLSLTWMFSALVLSATFGSVLLRNLSALKVQRIDSMDDLISFSNIQPIMEDHSSVYGMFKSSQSDVFQEIFRRATREPGSGGIMSYAGMRTAGMESVQQGSSAMLSDGMGLKGFMAQRQKEGLPCRYWLAKETVRTGYKVLAFGRDFPEDWILKINKLLGSILEADWLHSRMKREFYKYEKCVCPEPSRPIPLGLDHTTGMFLIWLMGAGVSSAVFLAECFVGRRCGTCCAGKRK